uniref:Glycine N-acyltransferase-like protein n=1 Tax=Acrobeloides nanus TaxID=290746 RepID=A0A914CAZ4_9BILA
MINLVSLFNHLYTLPEHREKGLGNATERDLSKKCIRLGITPCKTVETFNTEVLKSSNRSPYWTRWDDEGKPIEYIYMVQEYEKRFEMEKNKIENGH